MPVDHTGILSSCKKFGLVSLVFFDAYLICSVYHAYAVVKPKLYATGASGTTTHIIRYIKMIGKTPKTIIATKINLITVGSTPKYSAIPPQTPAILRSVVERYSFFCIPLTVAITPQKFCRHAHSCSRSASQAPL